MTLVRQQNDVSTLYESDPQNAQSHHLNYDHRTCTSQLPNDRPSEQCASDNSAIMCDSIKQVPQITSAYNIENSSDVIVGPVTHFHCPVTIVQPTEKPNQHDDPSQTSSRHLAPQVVEANFYNFKRRKPIIIILSLLLLTTFIVTTVVLTLPQDCHDNENVKCFSASTNISQDGNQTTEIFPREFWGARPPLSVRKLQTPVKYVLVAHTASYPCNSLETCAPIMQSLQSIAVDSGSPDIGYNFLIGGDANIYVGRDWDAINYLQNHCISVAFIGNFMYDAFTPDMQRALKDLIALGVQNDKVVADYVLLSHSQTTASLSPGNNVRNVIKNWEHYYQGDFIELLD